MKLYFSVIKWNCFKQVILFVILCMFICYPQMYLYINCSFYTFAEHYSIKSSIMEHYGFAITNWFSFPKLCMQIFSELRFKYLLREQIPIFKDDERDLELSDKNIEISTRNLNHCYNAIFSRYQLNLWKVDQPRHYRMKGFICWKLIFSVTFFPHSKSYII